MSLKETVELSIKAGLRSVAASVPVAASISQAWNEYETWKQSKRIDDFFRDLKREIRNNEERITKVEEYIKNSGDIPILLEETVLRAKRAGSEKKVRSYARLLTNLIAEGTSIAIEDKVDFIECLETLSHQDLTVLSTFETSRKQVVEQLFMQKALSRILKRERIGVVAASLSKLEARGLITETIDRSTYPSFLRGSSEWEQKWNAKWYEVLPRGQAFMRCNAKPHSIK